MSNWFTTTLLAKVEEIPASAPVGEAAKQGESPFSSIAVILIPVIVVMFAMQFFGNNPRKQAAQQLERLKALKKNDTVVTIGGIRGNFVSLSEDGSEVTLQLNDNMRVRFDASAIRALPAKS